MTYRLTQYETPKTTMLGISGAMRVANSRCWCVPLGVLNFFHLGIAALTAVTVFRVLVLVENVLQSHISVV